MELQTIIDQIEAQFKEQDSIYRGLAARFGLADMAFWVLYVLSVEQGPFTQQDLCRKFYAPKQTINTTISRLVQEGHVRLEPIPGSRNAKQVCLTPAGTELANRTARRLHEAELRAYGRVPTEELLAFLASAKKQTAYLREETEKLFQEEQDENTDSAL